jgi:hypothetical protein
MTIFLQVKNTEIQIAEISQEQLRILTELLVMETPTDRDFFLDAHTLSYLRSNCDDADLLRKLSDVFAATSDSGPYRHLFRHTSYSKKKGVDLEWREV